VRVRGSSGKQPKANRELQHERTNAFRDSERRAIDGGASFDQARRAFEKFIDNAQATADQFSARTASVRAGAKDVGAVTLSFAEKNVQASLDYAESVLHAKDLSEVLRLQREYWQTQMRSMTEQASEMGQVMSRAALEAANPKH